MTIYLNEHIHPDALQLLKQNAEIVNNFDEIENIDAIILRVAPITRDIIKNAKNLKVIGKHGIGCDTIDLEAAKEFGIKVLNTPKANVNSVAELIVGLILSVCRNIQAADAGCRQNVFQTVAPKTLTGVEISDKTLGLVGMGNISRRTAEILHKGFGMNVIWYDPYIKHENAKLIEYKRYEKLEEMISLSDIINVSVPLTDSTKNLISGDVFKAFKKDSILINAARGGIVNEEDLYKALSTKQIRGAACDAFVNEPPTNENKLLSLPNFCATPHIGAATEEALYRMGMQVVSDVINVLNGEKPSNSVI